MARRSLTRQRGGGAAELFEMRGGTDRPTDARTLLGHRGAAREVRARLHIQRRADRPLEAIREPVGGPRSRGAGGLGLGVAAAPNRCPVRPLRSGTVSVE